jgi:2-succinyl-5-enolpyruvyl-6-hydroxy-3-cyclohexene-1-carboxylate synthase
MDRLLGNPTFAKHYLHDLARHLREAGVKEVVVCPGSRSAPLTLGLVRSSWFRTVVSVDERAAGFVALGLGLRNRRPVVLVCTSGTAVLNTGPAVAEAFYLRVPLLILSADRPLGYAGHQKGQVIQQVGVLSPHVHASLSWSPDLKPSPAVPHDASEVVREALRLAVQRQGPVHVNVHLEEPLYQGLPSEEPSEYGLGTEGTVASEGTGGTGASEGLPLAPPKALVDDLHECLLQGSPVWFLAGMGGPSHALTQALEQVEKAGWGILFKEDLANIPGGIRLVEGLLDLAPTEPPGMLLSWGGPLVSKSLQEYLRTHQPRSHWRLDAGAMPSTPTIASMGYGPPHPKRPCRPCSGRSIPDTPNTTWSATD